jgi:hypothetical protein
MARVGNVVIVQPRVVVFRKEEGLDMRQCGGNCSELRREFVGEVDM